MADLKYPDDVKYTQTDEWVRIEGDVATIGISDYAQDALNDIVYVELPETGEAVEAGAAFGSVESVKAASDLSAPVSGTVMEVNEALEDDPEVINTDPYGAGWMIKVKLDGEADLSALMDAAGYRAFNADR